MKILFITRKFPPMVGGMEKLSFALAKEFSALADTSLVTWGKSQKYLPYFIIYAFCKAILLIPTKKINHIHIGDGLLSPLGLLLKVLFGIKTTITIAGLDITFNFPGYQLIVPRCIARLDKVFCISNATLEECIKRGIPKSKCIVIPCGVYPEQFVVKADRQDLAKIIGTSVKGKKVAITVGRLVKRKGVFWFIQNVMPKMGSDFIYLVIGDGPERERIEHIVNELSLGKRVLLLGKISDSDLKIIYNTAAVFVMPNIKVKNDVEGFGIVAIEASSAGLPVVASNMEGISNAVLNGKTGFLVTTGDIKQFVYAIKETGTLNRKNIAEVTKKNYSWRVIGEEYIKHFL